MKLRMLPEVLFDEFPTDETFKYCIFTQPKIPQVDYSSYIRKVTFLASRTTLGVMTAFKKLPLKLFHELTDKWLAIKSNPNFKVCCVPSGNVSGSAMILIDLKGSVHVYTGQFTQCQSALLHPVTLRERHRINDIHVDNTIANFRTPDILYKACRTIKDIIDSVDASVFTIYLHMDMFGCEELLAELACIGVKIQLNKVQEILFKRSGFSHLFEFTGRPHIKVYAPVGGMKPLEQEDYKREFKENQIIHIRLLLAEHEFRSGEDIPGLVLVPYTPHASGNVLFDLFKALQPKYVHPLISQGFIDDPLSLIPADILNDGCGIVNNDAFAVNDYLDDSSFNVGSIYDHWDDRSSGFGSINCHLNDTSFNFGSINGQLDDNSIDLGSMNGHVSNERDSFLNLTAALSGELSEELFDDLTADSTVDNSAMSATNTQEQNVNRENDNQPMEIHAASGKTPSKCQHEIDTDLEKSKPRVPIKEERQSDNKQKSTSDASKRQSGRRKSPDNNHEPLVIIISDDDDSIYLG